MLWKFSLDKNSDCHYIFGTMHLGTESAYTYANLAEKYIKEVDLYAAELDLNESLSQNMLPYFTMPEGSLLSDLFKKREFEKYCKMVSKSFNFDLRQYNQFTPFYIFNLLAESSTISAHSEALDHHLWHFAQQSGKELHGLESFGDQVNILRQIPMDYQVKIFRDGMSNISKFREKIAAINAMYGRGDIKNLYRSSKKSMGKLRKFMIYDRNTIMAERMISLSSRNQSFFAMGAAHLPGDKGILSLLKKKQYSVVEVKM